MLRSETEFCTNAGSNKKYLWQTRVMDCHTSAALSTGSRRNPSGVNAARWIHSIARSPSLVDKVGLLRNDRSAGYILSKQIGLLNRSVSLRKLFDNEKSVQTEQIPNSVFLLSVFSLCATLTD